MKIFILLTVMLVIDIGLLLTPLLILLLLLLLFKFWFLYWLSRRLGSRRILSVWRSAQRILDGSKNHWIRWKGWADWYRYSGERYANLQRRLERRSGLGHCRDGTLHASQPFWPRHDLRNTQSLAPRSTGVSASDGVRYGFETLSQTVILDISLRLP